MIMTGDADACAEVENIVNANVTEISGGGEGDVTVENDNSAIVENEVNVEANTGGNSADGGEPEGEVLEAEASESPHAEPQILPETAPTPELTPAPEPPPEN